MDALRLGIFALFTASTDLYADIPGRLFYGKATGANLSEGEYAILLPVSSNPDDAFAKERREAYIQFSLFSGNSSPAKISEIATHLIDLLKDKPFDVTGWKVEGVEFLNDSLPIWIQGETEAADDGYWQDDVEFNITLRKN